LKMDYVRLIVGFHQSRAMGMLPVLLIERKRLRLLSRTNGEPSSIGVYGFVVEVLQEVAAAMIALALLIIVLAFFFLYCLPSLLFSVTQQYPLTKGNYCNTVMSIGRAQIANILRIDKQVQIISSLAEGSGIRQIERMTGVHRDTIMRLGVRVGNGCASLMDRKMRDLSCDHLQFDEVWGFIGKKQKHVQAHDAAVRASIAREYRLGEEA
jgi:hypothetical protein